MATKSLNVKYSKVLMDEPEVVDGFYGVYLLYSLNEKPVNHGKTYIGFTVNPVRRNKQHNRGTKAGGARNTSNRGPWKMILIVHGFPNNIAALRFEWAWQHPDRSRRLTHIKSKRKGKKESQLEFRVRILSEMLKVGPWKRLPLIIRWIDSSYYTEFTIDKQPPLHMPICYGPVTVTSKSKKKTRDLTTQSDMDMDDVIPMIEEDAFCSICGKPASTSNSGITCLDSACSARMHKACLADRHLEQDQFVPVEVTCPGCQNTFLWGDLIRKSKGLQTASDSASPKKSGGSNDVIWELSSDGEDDVLSE